MSGEVRIVSMTLSYYPPSPPPRNYNNVPPFCGVNAKTLGEDPKGWEALQDVSVTVSQQKNFKRGRCFMIEGAAIVILKHMTEWRNKRIDTAVMVIVVPLRGCLTHLIAYQEHMTQMECEVICLNLLRIAD